ncbi:sulfur carrier protein ThiS [Mycolicibacterium sp. 3033]|nr:sulfur carrier protein ThiS [Mycolicibacterium aurantiacum]
MKLTVNDKTMEMDGHVTVAALLGRLGYPEKGIAVAVDWAVIPRSQWDTELTDGAKIDVVTAVQGG